MRYIDTAALWRRQRENPSWRGPFTQARHPECFEVDDSWAAPCFMSFATLMGPPGCHELGTTSGGPRSPFVGRLIEHVERCGGYLKFGSGVTPGLSGSYPVNGEQRPVFNLDAPERRAYLSFHVSDLVKQVSNKRLEEALGQLEAIPA